MTVGYSHDNIKNKFHSENGTQDLELATNRNVLGAVCTVKGGSVEHS